MSDKGNGRMGAAVLRVANRLEELERLHAFLDSVAEQGGWPGKLKLDFLLCCEELVTNTIHYGFPQGGDHTITITAATENGIASILLEDGGIAFNPLLESKEPDISLGIEDRDIGGLGVFFVKSLMDTVQYERTANGNRLSLAKALTTTQ
ncbi:ATP-binding protein [Cohnella panacarvi]|uniref:ATP-binding protein n=1 Tax=Cohnella panacarvi TaxID=400776 RepID=UPI00047AD903|nr:ATP-binding protein [Cohnella panacarvi]